MQIDQNSIYLDKVKNLWRKNSSTLGFFPDGAFREYANKKQILVGLKAEQELFGYLIYRTSKMKVGIVHLCIDPKYRGEGLTKEFIDFLKELTLDYQGIFLRCRRDFLANDVWPKLGFVPIDENIGKSIEGKPLCYWWYDYGHPTLFSEIKDDRKVAVLDANVFFDITEETDSNAEVNALLLDFVQGEIKLCLTAEIYNEINRNKELRKRETTRDKIYQFDILTGDPFDINRIQNELNNIMPKPKTPSDVSDRIQLSHAILKNASFFVTRDKKLLNHTDILFKKYGIRVIRPSTLIIHIDEMLRESEYQPVRLAGSSIKLRRISFELVENLINIFWESSFENKTSFKQKLTSILAAPMLNDTFIIEDIDNNPLALYSIHKYDELIIEISLLRILKDSFSSTLARHILNHIVVKSMKLSFKIVRIIDSNLSEDFLKVLPQHGFIQDSHYWIKICLEGIYKQSNLIEIFQGLGKQVTEHRVLFDHFIEKIKVQSCSELFYETERMFWPLKICEVDIPVYIIPIKFAWAMQLFDEELANRSLFGVEASLALNVENAYYTSRCFNFFKPPARIIWYVSENKNNLGTKCLRACSVLTEVIIDKPKELFRKYQRYGVFEWTHVFELAKKDKEQNIMGFQFSNTEQFKYPVNWKKIQTVLDEEGIKSTFQTITRISHSCFLKLYELGTKGANN